MNRFAVEFHGNVDGMILDLDHPILGIAFGQDCSRRDHRGTQVIAQDAANTTSSFSLYDETGTVTSTQAIDKQAPLLDFGRRVPLARRGVH